MPQRTFGNSLSAELIETIGWIALKRHRIGVGGLEEGYTRLLRGLVASFITGTPDAELSLVLLAIERARFDRRDSISWQGRNVRIHAAS